MRHDTSNNPAIASMVIMLKSLKMHGMAQATLELAAQGIRVNAVAPGVMLTAMTEKTRQDPLHVEYMLRRIPMKRYGEPHEIAGPIAFLASPLASYMTGVVIPVDGGYLIS